MRLSLLILLLIPQLCFAGVDFNGDGDYISVDAYDPYTDGITISMLVNQGTATSTERTIWRAGVNYLNFIANNTALRFEITTVGGTRQTTGAALVGGTWTYVAATYDEVTQIVYVNGAVSGSDVRNEAASFGSVTTAIGSRPGSENWDGMITEVTIWDTALTADEIALLHNSKVKGIALQIQPSRLQLYLPMDNHPDGEVSISGDTYVDRSGNGRNGTGVDADGDSINKGEEVLSYP